jgi:flagellar assembly factor FliW
MEYFLLKNFKKGKKMIFEVKKPILGFENFSRVKLEEVDRLFATLEAENKSIPSFTLINPYALKEYSFDIPRDVQILLDINENSNILVYNIVVLHNPITESIVNFKAPLVFNKDNNTMAQFILEDEDYLTIGECLEQKNEKKV